MIRQLIKANRTVLNIIRITVQCCIGFYSVTDILRDRPARLDRPESGTIRKALVRSSSFEYFIGVSSQALNTKNLSYTLILVRTACRCASHPLFRQSCLQEMRELYISCLGDGLGSLKKGLGMTACTLLRRICSLNQSESENFPYKPSSYSVSPNNEPKKTGARSEKKPTSASMFVYDLSYRSSAQYYN